MNTTMLQNQTKSSKVYQLAIEYSQYSGQENLPQKKTTISNSNKLPKILDVDQEDRTTRKKSPFKNIFNTQSQDNMRSDQLTNEKSFNIVGRKQVKAQLHKLVKKKNVLQKRNQSALSLSRYSSSVKSQNQTGLYLNKEDVLSFLRPSQNCTQNESKLAREDHMITMGSNKSKLSQFQMPSLRRSKDAFEQYTRTWDKGRMKKVKFPSILDHIASYRKKVQEKEFNTLKEKTTHMKDAAWIDTLREQKNLENFYSDKFVERILKGDENFCLKGRDKLHKEMQWIDEKDKTGYTFAFLDNLAIQPARQSKEDNIFGNNKEENLGESKMNHTIMRESSMIQKIKDSQVFPTNIVVRSNASSNIKEVLRESSIGKGFSQIKTGSRVGLSQFSSTGSGFLSGVKNRPHTIGEVKEGVQERKSVRIR